MLYLHSVAQNPLFWVVELCHPPAADARPLGAQLMGTEAAQHLPEPSSAPHQLLKVPNVLLSVLGFGFFPSSTPRIWPSSCLRGLFVFSLCCSEPGTAVRAGEFANYMILLLIILIMSTQLGDISLCCSVQVLDPQALHLGTHPDPLWGSQALRGAGRAPSPQRLPKGGGRWGCERARTPWS